MDKNNLPVYPLVAVNLIGLDDSCQPICNILSIEIVLFFSLKSYFVFDKIKQVTFVKKLI